MGFLLFLLVNATLFVRPAEVVPELMELPIYNVLILGCFAYSYPVVLRQLSGESLVENPITACVVGLLGSVVLSHLSHLHLSDTLTFGFLFAKVVMYYLLLVGLVDSTDRLRRFLYWLGWMIFVLTALALLQYHGMINVPALQSYAEEQYGEDGVELTEIVRLCSTGIYNNPNSLSRILVTGLILSLYWLSDRRSGLLRWIWTAPLVLEGYALTLTQSRGGFMGLMASLLCLLYARFGAKKAFFLSILAVPVALALKGRQADISLSGGTGHQRLEIWAEGWRLFRGSPIFGIGMDQFVEEIHYVAHNSFFHCFAELGFVGGSFYVGMFYLAIRWPLKLGCAGSPIRDPEFRRVGRYLAAIIAGEAVGQLSITRSYEVPTYLLIGLAAVYLRLAASQPSASIPRLSYSRMTRLMTILLDLQPSASGPRLGFSLVAQVSSVSLALLLFLYMLMKL
ncbi:O-antigen ligase family protein [Paludisphaera borealis]|uniref:O-antigen ligase like membrane protein n=1 Tax=Paludisphaera borealis TaxID=1387353 RepID=A0A1U7CLV1_9BACT|nr:O-antigen ligase family protein [Paludisphaera borealis]APW59899.1 O-antigen ligase like membrane protein [Paludisphaera borealis]